MRKFIEQINEKLKPYYSLLTMVFFFITSIIALMGWLSSSNDLGVEVSYEKTNLPSTLQKEYNDAHDITPASVQKEVGLGLRAIIPEKEKNDKLDIKRIPKDELPGLVKQLTGEMQLAAMNLEFERAAEIRDTIHKLEDDLLLVE